MTFGRGMLSGDGRCGRAGLRLDCESCVYEMADASWRCVAGVGSGLALAEREVTSKSSTRAREATTYACARDAHPEIKTAPEI